MQHSSCLVAVATTPKYAGGGGMQFTTNSQGQIQSNESEYWITFDEWIDPFGGNWVSAWPNILRDPWMVGKEMRGKHIKVMELFPSHQNGDWLLLKVFNTSHIYRRCFQSLMIILTAKTGNWQFHHLPFLITSTTMNRYFTHVWIRVDYVAQSDGQWNIWWGAFLGPLWPKRKTLLLLFCYKTNKDCSFRLVTNLRPIEGWCVLSFAAIMCRCWRNLHLHIPDCKGMHLFQVPRCTWGEVLKPTEWQ